MEGITLEQLQVEIGGYIKPLQKELKKATASVDSAVNQMQKQMDGLTDKTQNNVKKTSVNMQKSMDKATMSFRKLIGIASVVLPVTALVSFGKECVSLASDLQEVQNVVDVTFGSMSEKINQFAKEAITNLGLSETSAKRYASTMGAMLKSMGFVDGREVYDMSTQLTSLAADMASFYNISSDDAFTKIRSGMSGETEPLKQLGINLSVANLEAYALSKGLTKSYNAMTQHEQATLRYQYLLKVTADAQGDFARTSGSWANQVRILTENFNSFKASIGTGLINMFTPVLTVVNIMLDKFKTFAVYFNEFTGIVFGNAQGGSNATTNVADDVTDSLSNVTASAKEAKRALMGFDEIQKFESTDISTLTATVESITAANKAINDMSDDKVSEVAQRWADTIRKVFGPAGELLEDLKNGDFLEAGKDVSQLAANFTKWLAEAVDNIDWKEIGRIAGGFLAGATSEIPELAAGAVKLGFAIFDGILDGIKGAFEEAPIETVLITSAVVLKWTGLGKKLALSVATGFMGEFIQSKVVESTVSGAVTAGSATVATKAGTFLAKVFKVAAAGILGFKGGNWLNELITGEDVDMSMPEQIGYLVDSIKKNGLKEISEGFQMTFTDIGKSIDDFFNTTKIKINGDTIRITSDQYSKFMAFANDTSSSLNSKVSAWLEGIGIRVDGSNEALIEKLKVMAATSETQVADVIYKIIEQLETNASNTIAKLQSALNGLGFTEFERKLEDLRDKIRDSLEFKVSVSAESKGVGQNITSKFYSQLGMKSLDPFPEFKSNITFGGMKANGGYVNSGQLFIAREAGPELVGIMNGHTAVANNTQIVSGIEGGVARAISIMVPYLVQIANNTKAGNNMSGASPDEIFLSVQQSARRYTMRTGLSAFPT